jgi:transcriptional regulator with XRE-family HTH domain
VYITVGTISVNTVGNISRGNFVTLGEKIRELRTAAGMTQVDLAAKLGVGQAMVAAVEGGRKTVGTPAMLYALYDTFGVDPLALRPLIESWREPENPPPARAKKKGTA